MRVLIVDDYADAADVTCMLMEMLGHDCQCVSTGTAALDVAALFDPDLVLCDIGLPDVSGYEVARALRGRARGRPLYLAAVTGWGDPEDRKKALEAGFDQHLTKPTDLAHLQAVLRAAAATEALVTE